MKKVWLVKTTTAATLTPPLIPGPENTYQQRKAMKPAYQELFRVLLSLPDKEVQKRVLDAINGVQHNVAVADTKLQCLRCNVQNQRTFVEIGTQTDDIVAGRNFKTNFDCNTRQSTSDDSRELITPPAAINAEQTKTQATDTKAVRKKRKRKMCVPQVIKKSHAQQAQQHLQPKLAKQLKTNVVQKEQPNTIALNTPELIKRVERSDSLCSYTFLSDDFDLFSELNVLPQTKDHIISIMAKEYLESTILQNGQFPIHDAVIHNDVDILRRQIFVWKIMRRTDLNDVVTDDDEDCLQLAIANDCEIEIINILLEVGIDINCIDSCSNTIIHLAILNEIKLDTLELLVKRIDLPMLTKLNDEGLTPLHIAVRRDRYLHAEVLVNKLDERLLCCRLYQRNSTGAYKESEYSDFQNYYKNACENIKIKFERGRARHKKKQRLLEAGEMRSGNTALFFAVVNNMTHFVYFLLAHLTDPRIENHGGQDAKTHLNEFGKQLDCCINVDKTMEHVISLLD